MKYFDKCLKKISENDEIDISIHCDAGIFEWLLLFIFNQEEYDKAQQYQSNAGMPSGWKIQVQKCQGSDEENSPQ